MGDCIVHLYRPISYYVFLDKVIGVVIFSNITYIQNIYFQYVEIKIIERVVK